MEYKKILYEVRDGVAVITINSPKTLNAITDEIIEELYQAITAAEADDGVRVMVLTPARARHSVPGESWALSGKGWRTGPWIWRPTCAIPPGCGGHQDLRKAGHCRRAGCRRRSGVQPGAVLRLLLLPPTTPNSSKHLWVWGCCPTPAALRPVQGGGRRPGRPDVHDGRARECGKGPGVRHCLPGGA